MIYRGKEICRVCELLAQSPKKTVFYRHDTYPALFSVDRYIPKEYIDGLKSRSLKRFVIKNPVLSAFHLRVFKYLYRTLGE